MGEEFPKCDDATEPQRVLIREANGLKEKRQEAADSLRYKRQDVASAEAALKKEKNLEE